MSREIRKVKLYLCNITYIEVTNSWPTLYCPFAEDSGSLK